MSPNDPAAQTAPQVKALNCPSCGAALTVRSFGNAVSLVCSSCHSVLDAQDPNLKVLQKFKAAEDDDSPLIPLGSRGSLRGADYEVIGFQRRTIEVEGIHYSWHEYILFNPAKGFRYLTEYDGHWNIFSVLRSLPEDDSGASTVTYLGETYRHFQTADATTTFVLGEFPWRVHMGETVSVSDYVSSPRVISKEGTGKAVTWSMGEYITGKDLWKSFNLTDEPPVPVGVYENQPSPLSASVKSIWTLAGVFFIALFLLLIIFLVTARSEPVFEQTYSVDTASHDEPSFVTSTFVLQGHTSDVELTTTASLSNSWIYVNYALINQDTGRAYDFGREVSYYFGQDSDGAWTEGSNTDNVTIPSVPPGNYYLRIEPESDPTLGVISYTVSVKRDVPQLIFFGIGLLALLIPAVFITWRAMNFEHLRWSESDYGTPPGDGSQIGSLENVAGKFKSSNSGGDE
jgi:Domain of unknown function (DUF4178)